MDLLVLLGAGVSLPTGQPTTEHLTNEVLEGEWHEHPDGLFYRGAPRPLGSDSSNWIDFVQPFLRLLKAEGDRYFEPLKGRKTNYEDLYFLAKQISDSERLIDNPAIGPFAESIRSKTSSIQFPPGQTIFGERTEQLSRLADRSLALIQCVVRQSLQFSGTPVGLDLILELAGSNRVHSLAIVTLNHDRLVEILLESHGVEFVDGFGTADGKIHWFDPTLFDVSDKIRLIKLRGSIDWFDLSEKSDQGKRTWNIGKLTTVDHWHPENADGKLIENLSGEALFLTGGINKAVSYNTGAHAEMLFRFHESLKRADVMVASGYSWGDVGVNRRILDWLYCPKDTFLTLLHRNPTKQLVPSGMDLPWVWKDLVSSGKLTPVDKWLCEVTAEELFEEMKAADILPW